MAQYQEPTDAEILEAVRSIGNCCDGPLNTFVILARATAYALDTGKHRAAAEAANNLLLDLGYLANQQCTYESYEDRDPGFYPEY